MTLYFAYLYILRVQICDLLTKKRQTRFIAYLPNISFATSLKNVLFKLTVDRGLYFFWMNSRLAPLEPQNSNLLSLLQFLVNAEVARYTRNSGQCRALLGRRRVSHAFVGR